MKGEDREAQRPKNHEAQDHKRDPGRLTEFIELGDDWHRTTSRVNVNNIYIANSGLAACQDAVEIPGVARSQRRECLRHRGSGRPRPRRYRSTPASSNSSGVIGSRRLRRIAAAEQRGDAMRQRPDVQRHHHHRRALLGRHGCDQRLGRRPQHVEGPIACLAKFRIGVQRDPRLEHRRVIGGLAAGEFQIGLAEPIERREGSGRPSSQARLQRRLEHVRSRDARHRTSVRRGRESGDTARPGLTPAQRAASAKVKPAGPFSAISSSAARTSASFRLPWW